MSRMERRESPTGVYHVMQRGVGKQIIFEDDQDRHVYLNKIKEIRMHVKFELLAYCLMDNHVHLLIRTENVGDVSKIMHRAGTGYALYYNSKYERSGHVFQGRYNCEIVTDQRYLFACVRYIHNNPIVAGICAREKYSWSSYNDYVMEQGITDRDFFMSVIGGVDEFLQFSAVKDETKIMDCHDVLRTHSDGLQVIRDALGVECRDGSVVNLLSRKERDRIIAELKKAGFSVREIERLTGISKSIIYRVK